MEGIHLMADLYECCADASLMYGTKGLRNAVLHACERAGVTVVKETFHQFGTDIAPQGATGVVLLAESHVAIHTWPELCCVTLDVYVCNFTRDNTVAAQQLFERLVTLFAPGRQQANAIWRGTPSGVGSVPSHKPR